MGRLAGAAVLAALLVVAAPAAAAPGPLGLDCAPVEGVTQCAGKVRTFDGVPLDAHLTLPAGAQQGLPLIMLPHGFGGQRAALSREGRPNDVTDTTLPWARRGYAALSLTSRGFHGSCGTPPNRAAPGCERGYIRLDDTRFEIRDYQETAGRLVDEGVVSAARIGVHGASYGGGVSFALAFLRDRIMQPDGSLAPWRSPRGTPISLAAAAPYIPWTDLVYALVPNGRNLDYLQPTPDESRVPEGVLKESFVAGLYAVGNTSGFFAPPGFDPDADVTRWFAQVQAGEPYDGNPAIEEIANELYDHHSSISIPRTTPPAPIFSASGWTDDLFPVNESLRAYNVVRAEHPQVPFALTFLDAGHQRGANKRADLERYWAQVVAWMDRHVRGDAAAPAPSGVYALTQTCPATAPSGGPLRAPTWEALHPGEVRRAFAGTASFTSAGGEPDVARAIDPVVAGNNPCVRTRAAREQQTAYFELPVTSAFTLLGSPTVIAEELSTTGTFPQVASRLWDVAPDGQQTLVARGVLRPGANGRHVFQLSGNGYRFEPGHVVRLQLLGRDAPFLRPSNGQFSVTVRDVELRLPTAESPGTGIVVDPAAPVVPPGRRLAPGVRAGGGSTTGTPRPRPRGARRSRTLRLIAGCRRSVVAGRRRPQVRRAVFRRANRRRVVDRRPPFRVRGRATRATVRLRSGRTMVLRAERRRCR